jgi:hypothetical protein
MIKLYYIFLFFFISAFSLISQSRNEYVVINYEGDVYYLLNNSSYKKVKVGDLLEENTNIKINLNSFVTILDRQKNQYLVLNGDRVIKIKDIFVKNTLEKPKEVPDFLSRIFSDFSHIFSTDNQSKKKYREGEVTSKFAAISPKKCLVLDDNITFRWTKTDEDIKFRFVLYDENFKLVKDTIVNNTILTLNETGLFKRGQEYIWQILSNRAGEKFKELSVFKFVDDSSKTDMESKFNSLNNILNYKKDDNSALIRGLLFEKYQYYSEALECYLDHIKKNDNTPEIEQLVVGVLEKIKVKISPKELLNHK